MGGATTIKTTRYPRRRSRRYGVERPATSEPYQSNIKPGDGLRKALTTHLLTLCLPSVRRNAPAAPAADGAVIVTIIT